MIEPFLEATDGRRLTVGGSGGPTIVGRADDIEVTFDVAAMSRHHAEIELRNGMCWLRDLGSKNGTFVNGDRLDESPVFLVDGDSVVFAGAVTVVFRDPAATPIAPRIGRLTGVWINPATDTVWVDAVRIEPPLSAHQFALLQLLDHQSDEVVPRADIVAGVWADAAASGVSDEAVAALVKRLRARLREGPLAVDYVEVVKGRGVRLLSGQ